MRLNKNFIFKMKRTGILNSVRTPVIFLIQTLVGLMIALGNSQPILARTHDEAPAPSKVQDVDEVAPPEKTENVSITPTEPPKGEVEAFVGKFNRDSYFYPYKKEIMARAGIVIGFRDSSDPRNVINPLIGFNYMIPSEFSPKYEVGADISFSTNRGHMWVMKRNIFNEKGSFRPYYNFGVMNNVVPSENLASFSNSENYLIRFGGGLENIIRPPRSGVVELELAVGRKDLLVIFTYGASWGF